MTIIIGDKLVEGILKKYLPPIVFISKILRCWVLSFFKWHIYFIIERRKVRVSIPVDWSEIIDD